MRIAREVALYNQGGIQNGIDSAEERASRVATSFITRVSEAEGIKVHNADDLTDYIQINSNGVDLVNDGSSIANFSESARVGKLGTSRFMINADSLQGFDSTNAKYFEVSPNGMTYGVHTVADTAYADGKASDAQSAAISAAASDATSKANAAQSAAEATASADATSKANAAQAAAISTAAADATSKANAAQANAEKTATNFITTDSTGIKVHNTNDSTNYTHIGSSGMDVYNGGVNVASFGAEGQGFNNDYGEEVLTVGKLSASTYSTKLNHFPYNNESPFTAVLPWGSNGVTEVRYYNSNYEKVAISPSYSESGRNVTFPAASCQTLQSNSIKYIAVKYAATGRFPYYTLGSDGVGAIGKYSLREGENTVASGNTSHAEGESTVASGSNSHAEGYQSIARGANSHAGGEATIAGGRAQTAVGMYNVEDAASLFIVGNGDTSSRSNALAVTSSGNLRIKGNIFTNNGADSTGGTLLKLVKVTASSVSSLPHSITNYSLITANMECIHSVLSNPSAQTGDWTVTSSDGYVTISGSISGTTNITLYLAEPST